MFWNGARCKISARAPGKGDVKLRGKPEPNNFGCPELPIINERSACQIYLAPPNKGPGRGLHLLRVGVEGEGGWGRKHIRGKRGFSLKTDWYIEQTIWGGKYEAARRRFVRHYKTATKACTVEVRVSNDRGIGRRLALANSSQSPAVNPLRLGADGGSAAETVGSPADAGSSSGAAERSAIAPGSSGVARSLPKPPSTTSRRPRAHPVAVLREGLGRDAPCDLPRAEVDRRVRAHHETDARLEGKLEARAG